MPNLVGSTLGKYQIVAQLGRGGMAEVYKAYQPNIERYVAIKVMHRHLMDDVGFVQRFTREATAVAQLRHPNIVTMYDFEVSDTLSYMVMEYIDGPTLSDELYNRSLKREPFSLLQIAKIFTALAQAIDYAHEQGTIHRDLKPANVMITPQGQIVLTDFGIVRLINSNHPTLTSTVVGTPTYMSPEQGLGETVDHRSDLYSLAVILYEMLTGQVPFASDAPLKIMMSHVSDPVPPPHTINPNLPPAAAEVLLKGLAKKPNHRYQHASEMAQALCQALNIHSQADLLATPLSPISLSTQLDELTPSQVSPENAEARIWANESDSNAAPAQQSPRPKPTATARRWVLLAALLGLLALLGGGAFLWQATQTPTSPTSQALAPTPTLTPATNAINPTLTATWLNQDDDRDGLSNAQELELNTLPDKRDTDEDGIDDGDEINVWGTDPLNPDTDTDGLRDGLEISRGLNPLSADSDADGTPDPQDDDPLVIPTPTATPSGQNNSGAISATATITPSPSPTPSPNPPQPQPQPQPSFSGKLVYQLENAAAENGIYQLNLNTQERQQIVSYGSQPHLSVDGTQIVWEEAIGTALYNLTTQQRFEISSDSMDRDPALSYQGDKVAYINNTAVYIWDGGGPPRNLAPGDQDPSWSPDDRWLLFTNNSQDAFKVRVDQEPAPILQIAQGVTQPVWGPDFQIAFVREGDIFVMDEDGNNQTRLTDTPAAEYDPSWSPDGRYLVFISERNGNPDIYVMQANGSGVRQITNTPTERESSPSWGAN